MSFSAGSITGKIALDVSGVRGGIADAVRTVREGADGLDRTGTIDVDASGVAAAVTAAAGVVEGASLDRTGTLAVETSGLAPAVTAAAGVVTAAKLDRTGRVGVDASGVGGAVREAVETVRDAEPRLSATGTIDVDAAGLRRSLLEAEAIAGIFGPTIAGLISNPMVGAMGVVKQLATAAFDGIRAGIGTGVRLAAEYEQAEIAFTTMLGSAEAAAALLGEIDAFAASTPFQVPELVAAAKGLTAYGIEAEQIIPTLRRLGDISAGLGIPVGELSELYGKARVQGRLFAQDINQLLNRGIPITAALAQTMGVAEERIRDMVAEGKVGFPELQTAIAALTDEGGKFSGLMAAQSRSLAGLYSTLQDNVGFVLREIGDGLANSLDFRGLLDEASAAVQETSGDVVAAVLDIVGAVKQIAPELRSIISLAVESANKVVDLLDAVGLTDPNARAGNPYDAGVSGGGKADQTLAGAAEGAKTPEARAAVLGDLNTIAGSYAEAAKAMASELADRGHHLATFDPDNYAGGLGGLGVGAGRADALRQRIGELSADPAGVDEATLTELADELAKAIREVEAARTYLSGAAAKAAAPACWLPTISGKSSVATRRRRSPPRRWARRSRRSTPPRSPGRGWVGRRTTRRPRRRPRARSRPGSPGRRRPRPRKPGHRCRSQ